MRWTQPPFVIFLTVFRQRRFSFVQHSFQHPEGHRQPDQLRLNILLCSSQDGPDPNWKKG